MAFATMEDYNGSIDLVFFARTWEINQDKVAEKVCIACKGKLDKSRDKPSFIVSSLLDLGKLRRSAAQAKADTARNQEPDTANASNTAANTVDTADATGAVNPPERRAAADARNAAVSSGAAEQTAEAPAAPVAKKSYRELHIRLRGSAAGNEKILYPLRDFLAGNPGPAQVFIHVPFTCPGGNGNGFVFREETVIRTGDRLNAAADSEKLAVLEGYEAVAEVWGA
jgi:DNA polymerase-3 subunit alpha